MLRLHRIIALQQTSLTYMGRLLLFFLCAFAARNATAQSKPSPALKRELDSIFVVDQYYREMIMQSFTPAGAQVVAARLNMTTQQASAFLGRRMQRNDSSDLRRIDQIMRQYGYPGKSLVGVPTNEAAFYVIQHAPLATINQYLPQIKRAAEQGELPFRLYAMMLDRQLMYQGQEQVYGTQGRSYTVKNPTTGQLQQKMLIWPIKNAASVNQRRKQAGFEQTVEENAKRLSTTYRVLTLEEAKGLLNQ